MKKKAIWLLIFYAPLLEALPSQPDVVQGAAVCVPENPTSLLIEASDKAILNFQSFDIGAGERVRFKQPSDKSCALSRVVGEDPTSILGALEANGRLFLINPYGIYFGPTAEVNAGSFIASTLNIKDEDFLAENYSFFSEGKRGEIVNLGAIGVEQFAILMGPVVQNRGSIVARAGKLVLASAEKVALDFNGDGLVSFVVEEEIEKALIQNYGLIQASNGGVELTMRAAKKAIQTVLNTDGIAIANEMIVSDGVIELVAGSTIAAKEAIVEGGIVRSSGKIDVSQEGSKGGRVQLLGDRVEVAGAEIDASGSHGGGEVLIGGDYQGKGEVRNASLTYVDENSLIHADAKDVGTGGKVIVWSDDLTIYEGQIFARGGNGGGNGGFVETSGKNDLVINVGNVHTLSPLGETGSWLLDPSSITIVRNNGNQGAAGLTTAATCSGGGFNLNDTTINNAASTVILCTSGVIRQNNNAVVNIIAAGVGITYGAASTPSSTTFQTGGVTTWSVVTNGGPLTFNGPVTIPTGNTMSLTTSGGNVTYGSTVNGAGPLTISAGAGTTTFTGAVGGTTALTSMNITSATITQSSTARTTGAISYTGSTAINVGGNVTTAGGIITMTGPVTASGSPTFDSTNAGGTAAGANINFTSTLNGAAAVTIRAGTAGNAIFGGAVGNTAPPTNLSFTSAAQIQVGSNITVSGANPLSFPSPVLLTGTSTITSNNANISFNSTLNGAQALTIAGGSGTTTFTGAVGGTTALSSLNATSATITQTSTARTTGLLSYTGSTLINIAGNITTTSNGAITLTGPVSVSGNPTLSTATGGGAAISFSSTVNGATALTLTAGTGIVTLSGAVGGTAPPTNLVFSSASQIQIGANITVSGANPLSFSSPVLLTGTSTITSNNANATFTNTLNGAQALTIAGGIGTTTFTGAVGGTTPLASLSATAATITQSSTAKTTGALSYTGSTAINLANNVTTSGGIITMTGPVNLTANPVTIDSTNGGGIPAGANISFSSTINGAQTLTVTGGTGGTVTMTGAVGGTTPLTSLTATGATITQSSTAKTTGAISYTGPTAINVGGNVTTSGGIITMTGPVAASGSPTFDSTNAGGTPAGANIHFTSTLNGATAITLRAGTAGTVIFGGAVGNTAPPTNLSFTSASQIQIGANITVSGAPLSFPSPVLLTGTSTITSNNASISFNSTLNGTQALSLVAGTGSITFTGAAGGITPLGALTVTSATNWTAAAITASSIAQTAGTGTTTFNGALSTTGASGIVLSGNVFNVNNNITTTGGGPLSITHSGTLTYASGVVLSIDGTYTDSGTGSTVFSGGYSLTTNGQNITFNRPLVLNGSTSLSTGAGAGNITFNGTVDGTQNLTLLSGLGNIFFVGGVGQTTPLNAITVTSANNITDSAISAASFTQLAGTGTTTFSNPIVLSGASGFSFTGHNLTINSSLSTALGGPAAISLDGTLVLGPSSVLSLDGAFTQSGTGSSQIAGSITTTNDAIQFGGAVSLTGNEVMNNGGSGAILFSSTLDGPGGLTITAGTGNITFTGAIGGTTRLGALLINSCTNLTTAAIKASSIRVLASSGTINSTGDFDTNNATGILLVGTTINRTGAIITTNTGSFTVTNSGVLTVNSSGTTSIDGSYTQNGTGAVNFTGSINTNNGNVSFASPVTLTGPKSINTNTGIGDILFSSTIDGGQTLTLSAGTGNITFSGNVGSATHLSAVTISSATNVTTAGIQASSITQSSGSGTSTFNGALNTNTVSGINLTGANFTFNNNVTTTLAGPMSVQNSGLLTIASGGLFNIGGAFTQTGGGTVSLAGQITAGGAIAFANAMTVSGSAVLTTAAANQNISLSGTVDGAGNLTVAAGTGNILFSSAVGGTTRLGNLTVSSAQNWTANGITAAAITQSSGTGLTLLNGTLNTNAVGGISLTANNITLPGSITTTNGGPLTIANSGTFNYSGASASLSGLFLQNGLGPVSFNGSITTNNQPITFSSATTLLGGMSLISGGGLITLGGTVDGNFNVNLNSGGGSIALNSAIGGGTSILALTIPNANNVSAQAITAASITQSAGTGTTTFNGALNTTAAGGISLTGTQFSFLGTVTTSASGPVTIAETGSLNIGAAFNLAGPFAQTGAGAATISANITTANQNISFAAPITLGGTVILNSGSGAIALSSTVNGANAFTLTSSGGSVTVGGAIGGSAALSSLTASGSSLSFANIGGAAAGVTGSTSLTGTSTITFTGTTYNANAQTYTAPSITCNGGALTTFTSTNDSITFSATAMQLSTGTDLTVNSAGGAIAMPPLDAQAGNLRTLTLNAGAGSITLASIGTGAANEFASLSFTSGNLLIRGNLVSQSMTFAQSGTIFLGANVATTVGSISFPVAVVRDTTAGSLVASGSNITFSSTVDGDADYTRSLTVSAPSGNILFTGAIGGVHPLSSLTLSSAVNATAAAISAGAIVQSAGSGTTTFNGALSTTTVSGINLNGSAFTFNNTVTTTTGGPLAIANTGLLTMGAGATLSLNGALNQTGSGAVSLSNSITAGDAVSFAGAATLAGATSISTAAANQSITFSSTLNGPGDLTLAAGTGNIIWSGAAGGTTRLGAVTVNSATNITVQPTSAASLNLTWGTGTFTFTGALNTNALAGIVLTGTNIFSIGGTITTSNGGPLTVTTTGNTSGSSGGPTVVSGSITQSSTGTGFVGGTFISLTGSITTAHNIILRNPLTLDTSGGGGDIIVQGTVNGTQAWTMNAGAGNIVLQQNVGAVTPIGAMTITSAHNVTTQAITAASLSQAAGTGTTLLQGAITTSGAAGISIVANAITRGAAITALNGGGLTITNSGLFTSTAAGNIAVSASFTQNGSGNVTIGGQITSSTGSISFSSPMALAGNLTLDTSSSGGNITLSQTVQGAFNLNLDALTGAISIGGDVGVSMTPIGNFTIVAAGNVSAQSIFGATITQSAGTGTSSFNGLNTSAVGGISLAGTAFSFNGPIATAALGPFLLNNSGLAVFNSGAAASIAAGFTQTNTGAVQLSNALTAAGTVQFNGPITLSGTASVNSTNNPITFFNTIDGGGNLTLNSGTNNLTIQGNVGSVARVGAFTIALTATASLPAITASSIAQTNGSVATTFNGALNTNGAGGIQLTGTALSLLGNATTANGGPITLVNSGLLTLPNGISFSSDGAFSQSGGGSISMGADITTTNDNISFTNAITLTGPIALSTGAGIGDISFGGTVDGAQSLTLTAGTGNITTSSALGGATRLGAILVNSANNISVQNITAASINVLSVTGTASLVGDFDTNGPAGIQLAGNNFTRTGAIVTTNGGPLIVNNSGLLTGTMINTTSIDGGYFQTGSGPVHFAGTIGTNSAPISFAGPITLVGPSVFDAGTGSGAITISNTIDGAQTLDLTAGSGNIVFGSAIGGTTPIGALTIHSATDITAAAISAASISGTSITGAAVFNGALSTSALGGISLSAAEVAFNANVATSGNGPLSVALTNSAPLVIANGISISLDGAFSQTGLGSVSLGGAITTTNDPISFASPVSLTANASLNTGVGAGDITFSSAMNGAFNLSLSAGTGNVNLNGTIGQSTPLTALTISSGTNLTVSRAVSINGLFSSSVTGLSTINGAISTSTISGLSVSTGTLTLSAALTTTNSGPISITNTGGATITAPITSSGSFTQSGGGAVSLNQNVTSAGTLQFGSALTLTGSIGLNSGNGNLTLSSAVDGLFDLNLTAGAGSILLSGALGGVTPLDDVTIVSAANATAAAITAGSLTQSAGTGLTHFTGALATSKTSGISLTGSAFQFDQPVSTTTGGPLSIVHTGTLTVPTTAPLNLNGAFTESGGGAVSLGANITTANNNISWAGPITLTHDATLNTGVGAGNISFANTIDGAFCLTLTSGSGNITFSGIAGGITPLNCLSATGANVIQSAAITTATTVAMTGAIQLGGSITTTNSDITLTGNVTRTTTNSITLSTGAGAGNISITGTINGNTTGRNLTVSAGTGTVTLGNTIGGSVTLHDLTVTGSAISIANIGGGSSQGATGTTSLNATSTITFTGTNYNNGSELFTAGTSFAVGGAGATTFTSSNQPITFSTGTIQLASDITLNSSGGNITLSDVTAAAPQNLTANASTGTFAYSNIGTVANPLNNVNLTATTFSGTPANIHAASVTFSSPTVIFISADVSSPGAVLTYNSPVVVTATPITFSTCDGMGGGAAINFNSTLDADSILNVRDILIQPCNNPVTFSAPVGGSAPLDSVTIDVASNININSTFTCGSLIQTGGTGTTTIGDTLTTLEAGGINLATGAITVQASVITTNGGPVVLNNSGLLTVSGASFNSSGAFQQTGAGAVSIASNITTTDAAISFNGAVTLTGPLDLTSVSASGGNISFTGTINGAQNLTLAAGTGAISFSSAIGGVARIGTLTIQSAANTTAAAITAASILQSAGTGTTTLNGAVDTNTLSGISLTGSGFAINSTVTTTALGPFSVTNSGTLTLGAAANLSLDGAFSQGGTGTVSLGGTIVSNGAISFAGVTTLSNPAVLNTSANSTNITFSSPINGANSLSLNAGAGGNVTFSGNVGSTTPIGALAIVNAKNVTAQNISAASITQTAGTGATTLGALTTSAVGGISLGGVNFTLNGNLITTNAGPVAIVNTGLLNLTAGAGSSIAGAFSQSGGGTVSLTGTLLTADQNISFANPVTLSGTANLSTGALGLGDITFSSTLDGSQNLTLAAGTGTILFSGAVGSLTRLGAITIQNAANVTYNQVSAASLLQSASSGTTLISGNLDTNGASGISIAGTIITQNGTFNTSGSGPVAITNSGLFTKGADIFSDGAFTQSGGGAVSLTGSITTSNNSISFANAITLAGDAALNTGSLGSGFITLSGTVDGAHNLALTAGLADVALSSAIGGISRIGSLTINSAGNLTASAITAASISQLSGSGTATFNGALNTNAVAGISLIGTNFTINSSVTTTTATTGANLSVANIGTFTLGSGAVLNIAGALAQSTANPVVLGGTAAVASTASFNGTATIPVSFSLDTSANNQPIQFLNTLSGPGNLTLTLGSGNLTFSQNAGSLTSLGALHIVSAAALSAQAITASSILQDAGTVSTFNGDLTANGAGGISLTGAAFTFDGNANSSGPISIVNSGALTFSANKSLTSAGAFSQSGGGAVSLAGTINTTNQNLSFANAVTLSGPAVLNTGSGAGSITISSTVNGGQPITLTAGTGDILASSNWGGVTPIGAITVNSAHDISIQSITALSISQLSGTGTSSLIGDLTTSGAAGMTFIGNNFTRSGALITTNGGSVVVTNSGLITATAINTTSIDGSYIANGTGTQNLAGTITTNTGSISILEPITLLGDAVLNSSAGTAGVTIGGTLNGAHALTVTAGSGNAAFTQPIGASAALTALTVSGDTITLQNIGGATPGVSGATAVTALGSIAFQGTTYNAQIQTYNAPFNFNMTSGSSTAISSNGSALTFQNGTIQLSATTNLTLNSGGGLLTALTIRSSTNALRTLSLSSGAGNISVGNIGLSGDAEFASASFSGATITLADVTANAVSLAPTVLLNAGGNIRTTNTALSFPTAVVLKASNTFSTGAIGGNITFSGTLNGDIANARSLTLAAGTGNILFSSAVGGTFPLGLLQIASAANVTLGNLSSLNYLQVSGSGTTAFNGTVLTTNIAGVQFSGLNFTISGSLTTTNGGSLTVANTGTFTLSGTAALAGALTQSGAGGVALSGSATAGESVSFAGPVTLSGSPSIDTSAASQNVTFSNTLNGNGNFTLSTGGGDILLSANAGQIVRLGAVSVPSAHNITIQNFSSLSLNATSTGTMTLNGALNSNGAAGITLAGVNFVRNGSLITTNGGNFTVTNSGSITGNSINTTSIDGSYTQNGAGPVFFAGVITTNNNNISFSGPITLLADGGFNTGSGAGNILISNTVDGTHALNFTAGLGNVTISSALGSTTPLGAVTISSAANVSAQAISADSIVQTTGSGTSTFNGALSTTGSSGINLTALNIVRGAAWTTAGIGGVTVANSGTFTSTAAGSIQSQGAFQQTTIGPVLLSGSVVTDHALLSFSGPITLSGATVLDTGTGFTNALGNITISNTIDGASTLTLNASNDNITVSGAIGNTTRLGALTISSANNVSLVSVRAASFSQTAGLGTTTVAGAIDTNAAGGVSLTGVNFTLSGSVTTTAGGAVLIANSGSLSMAAPISSGAAFSQTGTGPASLSSSISAAGSLSFSGALTVTGTASLTSSSQPVTLGSTLNGPGNLTINPGASTISLLGTAGATSRLGSLVFTQGTNISTLDLTATSITQSAGSGTTTIVGNLNTSGGSGIHLTGTNFTISGNLISTNSGPCVISHTGLLSLTAGASTLLTGPFAESGVGGTVHLGGILHASNSNISFANPITLTANTTLNSDGGGDITISSTIDGAFNLVYDAGTGNIVFAAPIGSITPVTSLTIVSANNVTSSSIASGTISQEAGTGISTFNGALATSLPGGMSFTGTAFDFEAPVTTTGNGPVSITNSGALTLPTAAPFSLTGAFSQLGAGAVSLCTTITTTGESILFTAPVTLCNSAVLNSGSQFGAITFLNTVTGPQNLTLNSGQGSILFSQNVGPLNNLHVQNALNFTSQAISAASIALDNVAGMGTFNGALTTSGLSGISLSGFAFAFHGNITTANSGPFSLDVIQSAVFDPTLTLSIDGAFSKTNVGTTQIGGSLSTNGQPISIVGPMDLNGNLSINSHNGSVTIEDVDGSYSLSIAAGAGDVSVPVDIGLENPLVNFTVLSANNTTIGPVGSTAQAGVSNSFTLNPSNQIRLAGSLYHAGTLIFSSGSETDFQNQSTVTLISDGGAITFSPATVINLSSGTDLNIETNGGSFSFGTLQGTNFENITIATGTGTASLGAITLVGTINTMTATAGEILLNGAITNTNTSMTSLTSILNGGAPLPITSANDAFFNALNGNVGSLSSPILVHTQNQIIAGAVDLADFNGSSVDNTVNDYPPNPPCLVIFNGVVIHNCHGPMPGPSPTIVVLLKGFPTPGFDDSQYNLASYFYFWPFFIDRRYFQPVPPMNLYTRPQPQAPMNAEVQPAEVQ